MNVTSEKTLKISFMGNTVSAIISRAIDIWEGMGRCVPGQTMGRAFVAAVSAMRTGLALIVVAGSLMWIALIR